ncbi:hypothetical protein P170DRAFT_510249 [Aspergillus steynii IBT 23096]|uniref:DUF6536 domain-containing protein n=1 Tax=Aspergillus steynii IBT 23096 TaxID=1392250 RepID=A0A2I2GA80_9EURO|nr:uncharacterized protein P170DRAFT_510249 [Aspergillus steynii IBT 23096]PLB49785.1 hypothetical protein P170DRAFT_510249 [Aspergillus steynii IBT 23096]
MHKGLVHQETELLRISDRHGSVDNLTFEKPGRQGRLRVWAGTWRFVVFLSFLVSLVVLLLNLVFLIWAATRNQVRKSRGVLFEGGCEKVQRLNVGIHFLINVLATIILAASNYGMQCLSAPTRCDVDRAHGNGRWLDIGVPSIRNLAHVSVRRCLLWIGLAFTALPLHLLYNATIFSTKSAHAYNVFAGKGSSFGQGDLKGSQMSDVGAEYRPSLKGLHAQARNESLERLDASQCVDAYATTFQTKYGSVLVATDDVKDSNVEMFYAQSVFSPMQYLLVAQPGADPYRWLCPDGATKDCDAYLPEIHDQIDQDDWVVQTAAREYQVNYCLAEKLPQHCKLEYSLTVTIILIVINVLNALILGYVALGSKESPLLTVGDAIASFLNQPVTSTQNKCFHSRAIVGELNSGLPVYRALDKPLMFQRQRKRWFSAASFAKWAFTVIFWLIAIVVCLGLLAYGLSETNSGHSVWNVGLGEATAQTIIKGDYWPTTVGVNLLVANAAQLIFSMLYFSTNSLLSAMTLAAEWSRFAVQRRGLRISSPPQVAQRSSYFLSLPIYYGIPFMLICALLHWLISQSLFVVSVEAYTIDHARDRSQDLITCGFSPVAIVSAVGVAAAIAIIVSGLACRRLASGMPIAGSCSLAIAAACHPYFDPNYLGGDGIAEIQFYGEDVALVPIKWGAVRLDGGLGHCTFSADEVDLPDEGRVYQ